MRKLFLILLSLFFCAFFSGNIIVPVSAQIASSAFRDLNIELKKNIATEYAAGDGILIEGKVLDKNSNVLFFLKNVDTEEKIMEVGEVDASGNFRIPVSLPKLPGEYTMIMTSGLSFSTTIYETITLVKKNISENSIASSSQIRPTIVYSNYPYLFF